MRIDRLMQRVELWVLVGVAAVVAVAYVVSLLTN